MIFLICSQVFTDKISNGHELITIVSLVDWTLPPPKKMLHARSVQQQQTNKKKQEVCFYICFLMAIMGSFSKKEIYELKSHLSNIRRHNKDFQLQFALFAKEIVEPW